MKATHKKYLSVRQVGAAMIFYPRAILREIHVELEDLNAEAVQLAETIKRNFEGLGV